MTLRGLTWVFSLTRLNWHFNPAAGKLWYWFAQPGISSDFSPHSLGERNTSHIVYVVLVVARTSTVDHLGLLWFYSSRCLGRSRASQFRADLVEHLVKAIGVRFCVQGSGRIRRNGGRHWFDAAPIKGYRGLIVSQLKKRQSMVYQWYMVSICPKSPQIAPSFDSGFGCFGFLILISDSSDSRFSVEAAVSDHVN